MASDIINAACTFVASKEFKFQLYNIGGLFEFFFRDVTQIPAKEIGTAERQSFAEAGSPLALPAGLSAGLPAGFRLLCKAGERLHSGCERDASSSNHKTRKKRRDDIARFFNHNFSVSTNSLPSNWLHNRY